MTRLEIKTALARDYRIAYSVYASLEKQAHMALKSGKIDAYDRLKRSAVHRSAVLSGMKRAAAVLGIEEMELMEAVNALKEGYRKENADE